MLLQLMGRVFLLILSLAGIFFLIFLFNLSDSRYKLFFVYFFKTAIIILFIILAQILGVLDVHRLILCENLTCLFCYRVCLHQQLLFIQCFENDLAVRKRLNNCPKFRQVEFFVIDNQSLGRQIYEYLTKSYFSKLLKL